MEKPIVKVDYSGPSGNIFYILSLAGAALKLNGKREEALKMYREATNQKSYENALKVINEYVEVQPINA